MCGITGILNLDGDPVSPVILKKMTDAIAHRGPDGEGQYTDNCLGLGHRRLAIIDLSPAGHQPMSTVDGHLIMTYNGEIYNFNELRIELESLGYQFRSRTDSEVLLYAYAEWGEKCLNRLNGMFAVAIWDKRRRQLFLARDRYGIKPLYYTNIGSRFIFGSEVKAILAHPDYPQQIDFEGLLEYFTFQNFLTDKTLFKNIKLLPAGTYICLSLDTQKQVQEQYWDYHFVEPDSPLDEREYLEELDRLFRQAVNRQLISDVELGAYLSGGIDSGSITAIAAQQLPYIKSFTCGFDLNSASGVEVSYDEREAAEYMSYLFKTEHYEMVLKAGDMERVMPRLAWHLEEPRVGQSYPNFYVSQLASKFVKVVLAGTGGDELFAGYPWRYYRAVVNDDFEHYVDKYYGFWQRLLSPEEIQHIFQPIWSKVEHISTKDIFSSVFKQHSVELTRPEDYVNHSLYFEAKTFLHGLLVVEDKLSMAHSLETRVPFLDNDLVDFAMEIPTRLKLGNLTEVVRFNENEPGNKTDKYFQKTKDGKLLLRKVMGNYIPKVLTERVKQGFSAPDASWFKGESIDYVRNKIEDNRAKIYDFLDEKTVKKLVNEHLEGKKNRRLLIWSLLNFAEWCKQFIN
ncbi:asparagine synthase (glutamine-hydrolyzing) [Nostoc sp. CHAB 5844]|nr:asparagine synthase (glutamine-hydrolyzing) [Nostoc sp. CHAB 5844]